MKMSFLFHSFPQNQIFVTFLFTDITQFCNHGKSIEFYIESIKNYTAFIGKCEFYHLNECNIEYIPMGYATPNNALV